MPGVESCGIVVGGADAPAGEWAQIARGEPFRLWVHGPHAGPGLYRFSRVLQWMHKRGRVLTATVCGTGQSQSLGLGAFRGR